MKTVTILAAAAATAIAAAPAAQADGFAFSFAYDAEKLETVEGAKEILSELEAKVERECRVLRTHSHLVDRVSTQTCVDNTLDDAIDRINSRNLSAAYSSSQQG